MIRLIGQWSQTIHMHCRHSFHRLWYLDADLVLIELLPCLKICSIGFYFIFWIKSSKWAKKIGKFYEIKICFLVVLSSSLYASQCGRNSSSKADSLSWLISYSSSGFLSQSFILLLRSEEFSPFEKEGQSNPAYQVRYFKEINISSFG